MEWLAITLSVVAILGLLWAFSQIGRVIEDLNAAEVEIADLKITKDRQAEDIAALSGLVRSLIEDPVKARIPTAIVQERR